MSRINMLNTLLPWLPRCISTWAYISCGEALFKKILKNENLDILREAISHKMKVKEMIILNKFILKNYH